MNNKKIDENIKKDEKNLKNEKIEDKKRKRG